MNATDYDVLRRGLVKMRDLLNGWQRLARIPSEGCAEDLWAEFAEVERDLVLLTEHVSQRASVAWGSRSTRAPHRPRHTPNRYIDSRETAHDVKVVRLNLAGRPTSETDTAPPLSGNWHYFNRRTR